MFVAFLINTSLIILSIIVHFEVLLRLSIWLPDMNIRPRSKVVLALLGALCAHIFEVWIFAAGYYLYIELEIYGVLTGNIKHSLLDYAYYSFITYTSLGFGDIIPTQNLRFLSGLEALTGLVLIAWSASYMYYQMEHYWKDK